MNVLIQLLNNVFVRMIAISVMSAVASALASAGAVWFVVDISIRGVELAVSTTNTRITELGNDMRAVKEDVPELEKSIQALSQKIPDSMDAKLDRIATSLDSISSGALVQLCKNDEAMYNSISATRRTLEEVGRKVAGGEDVALVVSQVGSIYAEILDDPPKDVVGWTPQWSCDEVRNSTGSGYLDRVKPR